MRRYLVAGTEHHPEVSMGQGALGKHRRSHAQQMPLAEDALRHLLLTVDVEHLYRSAMSTQPLR